MLGGLYSLIAISLNLQYSLTRMINVAHGELIMFAGYVTYWLFTLYGVSPILSVVATFPILFIIGLLLYRGIIRRIFLSYKVLEILEANLILVALGMLFIIQNLVLIVWTGKHRTYNY
ncbi:MAG: hypothetical protein QXO71_08305, partial [Candidatus Jordarchaeaceae archaeon]